MAPVGGAGRTAPLGLFAILISGFARLRTLKGIRYKVFHFFATQNLLSSLNHNIKLVRRIQNLLWTVVQRVPPRLWKSKFDDSIPGNFPRTAGGLFLKSNLYLLLNGNLSQIYQL